MLAALLLPGSVAAPLTSAALFVPAHPRRTVGAWPAARRLVLALLGTVVVGAIGVGALWLLGVPRTDVVVGFASYVVFSLLWLPATQRWNARGHLAWVSSVFLLAAYLVFV